MSRKPAEPGAAVDVQGAERGKRAPQRSQPAGVDGRVSEHEALQVRGHRDGRQQALGRGRLAATGVQRGEAARSSDDVQKPLVLALHRLKTQDSSLCKPRGCRGCKFRVHPGEEAHGGSALDLPKDEQENVGMKHWLTGDHERGGHAPDLAVADGDERARAPRRRRRHGA